MDTVMPWIGADVTAFVTVPLIRPAAVSAKLMLAVVAVPVTTTGVPLVTVQLTRHGRSLYSSLMNPRVFVVRT